MDEKDKTSVRLKLGFQYLGPEHGDFPFLELYLVDKSGTEYDIIEYAHAYLQGKISDEDFKKTIAFTKSLEKYNKDNITVSHVSVGEKFGYVSRIKADPEAYRYDPYGNMILDFCECVSDIYYDHNGRRIGFEIKDDNALPLEIKFGNDTINPSEHVDSKDARTNLALNLSSKIKYVIDDFNRNNVNGISEHRSPRR